MAVVDTSIAMTSVYQPFERPPQNLTLWSAIPRGLHSFLVATAALDAKPVNDTHLLTLTALLPPSFGYVFADIGLAIAQDKADDWDAAFIFNLQNFYRAAEPLSVALSMSHAISWLSGGFGTVRASADKIGAFAFPIIGTPGTTGIQISIQATNSTAAQALAGTVNAYVAFWQFDLEQIRKFPINSPAPTNAR